MRAACFLLGAAVVWLACRSARAELSVVHDETAGTIVVVETGAAGPLVTQHARADERPYLHPLAAPDGRGVLTEHRPPHAPHLTGLFWGLGRVNGRDYFRHAGGDYWRRVAAEVLTASSSSADQPVQWQTTYDLLNAEGAPIFRETHRWSLRKVADAYALDLVWSGRALIDVALDRDDEGGLFLRMPWRPERGGRAVNNARQADARAAGERAVWVDVGMRVDGLEEEAHVALFDHPDNPHFPQAWRIDAQLGTGPAAALLGGARLAAGETLVYRHRLRVSLGPLNDLAVAEAWSEYSGHPVDYAQWRLAQQEAREAELLSPEQAVAAMTVPEGFRANVYAAEPMITQPMAFCWDDRGRLWIAENRDYEARGDGFSRSGDSRILILEDRDRDGTADRCDVFLEGIPFPSALAVGFDGLWLGAPPNLLFVPDRDRDDRADVDAIEVRLTGWGILDRHETLNSFHWGPDGWLYGCQGFATPSRVGKPAGKGRIYRAGEPFPETLDGAREPVDINGGVWRYHPLKDRFEAVAHGFSNPWGIDHDAHGQLFVTACVIPHLWHVIPGGVYQRQGGSHFNPHVYRDLQTIADHRHQSAHGGARIYQSDAFPAVHRGRIFMANLHEHAVLSDVLEPRGSGFVGRHGDDFVLANNAQWIGFSLEVGPDGALYVLDWHDADICGKEVLHKETGRVFRIAAVESQAEQWPGRYGDLSDLSDLELARLQASSSDWHARRARLLLQHRGAQAPLDPAAVAALHAQWDGPAPAALRLRALWTLHVAGALPVDRLRTALDDAEPYVRAWAVQLLCEDAAPPPALGERLVELAARDESPIVRLYLAAALPRTPSDVAWRIAEHLVRRAEDASDPNIPLMTWFGVEPLVCRDPQRAVALAAAAELPHIARSVARRLAAAGEFAPIAAGISRHRPASLELLRGLRDGLEGLDEVPAHPLWQEALPAWQALGDEHAEIALQIALRAGDATAAGALRAIVADAGAPIPQRREALRRLAERAAAELQPELASLLDDPQLRADAIRAVAAFDEPQLAAELLRRYASLSAADRLEAVQALAARTGSGRLLTHAIENGDVPRSEIPAYVAQALHRSVGNRFLEAWGPLAAAGPQTDAAFARLQALLTPSAVAAADARRGRLLFQRHCAACHALYGQGSSLGPDLTGAHRTSREYLLSNVVTPSAVIQEAYRMQVVLTDDGRVFAGIPVHEDERSLTLRVANASEPLVLPKSRIASREIAESSLMPEGLLNPLSDAEVLDLFAYLQGREQVPLPDEPF